MTKIFLLFLATIVAVIHRGSTANVNRTVDESIRFVDAAEDDSETIREKIISGMENYKRLKEMFKIKASSTIETSSATEATTKSQSDDSSTKPEVTETSSKTSEPENSSTSSTLESSTKASEHESSPKTSEPDNSSAAIESLTKASVPETSSKATEIETPSEESILAETKAEGLSSTVRPIKLDLGEGDNIKESAPDPDDEETTETGSVLDDRFILNAPVICKAPRLPDKEGKCRMVLLR